MCCGIARFPCDSTALLFLYCQSSYVFQPNKCRWRLYVKEIGGLKCANQHVASERTRDCVLQNLIISSVHYSSLLLSIHRGSSTVQSDSRFESIRFYSLNESIRIDSVCQKIGPFVSPTTCWSLCAKFVNSDCLYSLCWHHTASSQSVIIISISLLL